MKGVSRIEVLDGPTGRRRWPDDLKARIVADSFQPGTRVCDVAAKYGLNTRHLSRWRGQPSKGELVVPIDVAPAFVPLVIKPSISGNSPTFRINAVSRRARKIMDRRLRLWPMKETPPSHHITLITFRAIQARVVCRLSRLGLPPFSARGLLPNVSWPPQKDCPVQAARRTRCS